MTSSLSPSRWSSTPARVSASTPSSVSSSDRAYLAVVDKNSTATTISKYQSSLDGIHEAFPDGLWPLVEPTTSGEPSSRPLYPGRVLMGHANRAEKKQRVWAYLWKVNSRGDTTLDFWDDASEPITIDTDEFKDMDFEPWCEMLAKPSSTLGSKGGWETRVKAMIKIALLDGRYYDGTCDSAFNTVEHILNIVHQVSDIVDLGDSCSDGEFAGGSTDARNGLPIKSEKNTDWKHLAETIRKAFPSGVWPRVEDYEEHSSTHYTGRRNSAHYPGRVYIGTHLRSRNTNGSRMKIWAIVSRKNKEYSKRSGHVKCFFDNGKCANFREGKLDEDVEFDRPFQLVRSKVQGDPFSQASMYNCVRVALIEGGYINGADLQTHSPPASGTRIAAMITRNLDEERTNSPIQSARAASVDSVISSNEIAKTAPRTSLNEANQGSLRDRSGIVSENVEGAQRLVNTNLLSAPSQKQPPSTIPTKRPLEQVEDAEAGPSTTSKNTSPTSHKSPNTDAQHPSDTSPPHRLLVKLPLPKIFIKNPLNPIPSTPSHTSSAKTSPQTPLPSTTKPSTEYKLTPQLANLLNSTTQLTTLKSRIQTLEATLSETTKDLQDADIRTENALNEVEHEREKVQNLNTQMVEKDEEMEGLRRKVVTYQNMYAGLAEKFKCYVDRAKPRLVMLGVLEASAEGLGEGEAAEVAGRRYVEEFGGGEGKS